MVGSRTSFRRLIADIQVFVLCAPYAFPRGPSLASNIRWSLAIAGQTRPKHRSRVRGFGPRDRRRASLELDDSYSAWCEPTPAKHPPLSNTLRRLLTLACIDHPECTGSGRQPSIGPIARFTRQIQFTKHRHHVHCTVRVWYVCLKTRPSRTLSRSDR